MELFSKPFKIICIGFIICFNCSISAQNKVTKFNFGTKATSNSEIAIVSNKSFSKDLGYGFDFDTAKNVEITKNAFSSNSPIYFSVKLPEGNYKVEIVMGSIKKNTQTTVKAESRRLMLDRIYVAKNQELTTSFNINIRTPKIDAENSIGIKDRELNYLNWDDKLTLEFLGESAIKCITITPIENITTIFLAGDSTVTDQDLEPWASWGQFITKYIKSDYVVANYAASGASLSSFKARRRLDKILSLMKPNDYLFIEFGHNDQKRKGDGIGPWLSYSDLLTEYITKAREKGGVPILLTPTQRRFFDENGTLINTHGEYPEAMKSVAKKLNVPLIDLTGASTILYNTWGDAISRKAFVQYPANTFPGQKEKLEDNTHFNSFGAHEIALCVVQGLKNLGLKKLLIKNISEYTPTKPNNFKNWDLPMGNRFEAAKPDGN